MLTLSTSFSSGKIVYTYVSPFSVLREVNYRNFTFWWTGVGDLNRIDLRYSFDGGSTYQTFYSTTDLNSTYSTTFSFKRLTDFVAIGIGPNGEEYSSGGVTLQVGHGGNK